MKYELTIERGTPLWGRVSFDENLVVDSAATDEEMVANMKRLLFEFYEINQEEVEFEITYE